MQADLYNGRKTVVLTPPQNTLMWHITTSMKIYRL